MMITNLYFYCVLLHTIYVVYSTGKTYLFYIFYSLCLVTQIIKFLRARDPACIVYSLLSHFHGGTCGKGQSSNIDASVFKMLVIGSLGVFSCWFWFLKDNSLKIMIVKFLAPSYVALVATRPALDSQYTARCFMYNKLVVYTLLVI